MVWALAMYARLQTTNRIMILNPPGRRKWDQSRYNFNVRSNKNSNQERIIISRMGGERKLEEKIVMCTQAQEDVMWFDASLSELWFVLYLGHLQFQFFM